MFKGLIEMSRQDYLKFKFLLFCYFSNYSFYPHNEKSDGLLLSAPNRHHHSKEYNYQKKDYDKSYSASQGFGGHCCFFNFMYLSKSFFAFSDSPVFL